METAPSEPVEAKPKRKPLPDYLDRIEQVLSIGADCPECGGDLSKLGEDVTEELEYIPGRFVVNKIIRPRMACCRCEAISQTPMPSRPIERGRPGSSLLAHVLVSKYTDHLPLYRQSQIYARAGRTKTGSGEIRPAQGEASGRHPALSNFIDPGGCLIPKAALTGRLPFK